MKEREYFLITGWIFIGVVLLHGIRFFGGLGLTYAGRTIPGWISGLAVAVGLIMIYYSFKFANRKTMPERIVRRIRKARRKRR